MAEPPVVDDARLRFVSDDVLEPQPALLAAVDYLEMMISEALDSPFLGPSTRMRLLQAWQDPSTDRALRDLRDGIRTVSLDQLLQHGLTGAHLEMKRGVIRHFDRHYRKLKRRRERPSMLGLIAAAFGRIAGFFVKRRLPEGTALKKIFEGLKSLFGSVLDMLNLKGPLKELVEFVFSCIVEDPEQLQEPLRESEAR